MAWLLGASPNQPAGLARSGEVAAASACPERAPDVGRLPATPELGEESESSGEDAPVALEAAPVWAGAAASTELASASRAAESRPRTPFLRTTQIRGPPRA